MQASLILGTNPFFQAYYYSDFLGKLIFISLIVISALSWIIAIYKFLLLEQAKRESYAFEKLFQKNKALPLSIDNFSFSPYGVLYLTMQKQTVDLIKKNERFSQNNTTSLTPADIDIISSHLVTTIAKETKKCEKQLYILSTIAALAPLLGLLGTVWGILTTFAGMSDHAALSHTMLSGISLALTTTVLGLVTAIPSLFAHNFIKNSIAHFEVEMENFATEILSSIELQYRRVDL